MKKAYLFFAAITFFMACKKTETTNPTNNNNNNIGGSCGDGFICFKLDGTDISKQGGGYEFSDTFLFVKYEEGTKQLSIDVFGKNTGNYAISNQRMKGNARIYYFPVPSTSDTMYMAETGSLNVSSYDAASRKISGTFSGTLYKYKEGNQTYIKTDSVIIKDGEFTNVQLAKQ